MTFGETECWEKLARAAHGVLATLHPERGPDVVPVVFALSGRGIVLPIDTVKAKRHDRLARIENLRRDPRCCLLVDHYSDDWSKLWWVRVHALGKSVELTQDLKALLASRHEQYGGEGALSGALLLTPTSVSGWTARD